MRHASLTGEDIVQLRPNQQGNCGNVLVRRQPPGLQHSVQTPEQSGQPQVPGLGIPQTNFQESEAQIGYRAVSHHVHEEKEGTSVLAIVFAEQPVAADLMAAG